MEQAGRLMDVDHPYFRRTHTDAELGDLPLQHLWIVYPGADRHQLDKAVSVLPVAEIADIAEPYGI